MSLVALGAALEAEATMATRHRARSDEPKETVADFPAARQALDQWRRLETMPRSRLPQTSGTKA